VNVHEAFGPGFWGPRRTTNQTYEKAPDAIRSLILPGKWMKFFFAQIIEMVDARTSSTAEEKSSEKIENFPIKSMLNRSID
jgi:hypothetical protein